MKKKAWLIVLALVALLCFCCLCCISIFFAGGAFANKEVKQISEDVIYPLCRDGGELSYSDYSAYFDDTEITISQAEYGVEDLFSDYDNCNDFKGKNMITSLLSGHSFEINSSTFEGTTATYSFKKDDVTRTIYLNKVDGDWLITDID